jgi:hypothetical protein
MTYEEFKEKYEQMITPTEKVFRLPGMSIKGTYAWEENNHYSILDVDLSSRAYTVKSVKYYLSKIGNKDALIGFIKASDEKERMDEELCDFLRSIPDEYIQQYEKELAESQG